MYGAIIDHAKSGKDKNIGKSEIKICFFSKALSLHSLLKIAGQRRTSFLTDNKDFVKKKT